jgi:hypothetical protein
VIVSGAPTDTGYVPPTANGSLEAAVGPARADHATVVEGHPGPGEHMVIDDHAGYL